MVFRFIARTRTRARVAAARRRAGSVWCRDTCTHGSRRHGSRSRLQLGVARAHGHMHARVSPPRVSLIGLSGSKKEPYQLMKKPYPLKEKA